MAWPADRIAEFVFENYVRPALEQGAKCVTIRASEVWLASDGVYSLDLVACVLGSMRFRNTYRLPLEATRIEAGDATYRFRLDLGRGTAA